MDPDIASYVHLINQCGICIYGKPINDVFPTIPEKDFWSSLSNGITEYDFHAHNRFIRQDGLFLHDNRKFAKRAFYRFYVLDQIRTLTD